MPWSPLLFLFVVMQRQSILYNKAPFNFSNISNGLDTKIPFVLPSLLADRSRVRSCSFRMEISCSTKFASLDIIQKIGCTSRQVEVRCVAYENLGELSDEDDELCPVDCVREFKTDDEFFRILERAKETNSLVVVDFYRTSCGSCKYIEQGFAKLCRGSGDEEAAVIFLKHNVIDEYDEESEVADRLRIKAVPLFQFYKNGVLLESFPTRDKERILAAILKYTTTSPASQEV